MLQALTRTAERYTKEAYIDRRDHTTRTVPAARVTTSIPRWASKQEQKTQKKNNIQYPSSRPGYHPNIKSRPKNAQSPT